MSQDNVTPFDHSMWPKSMRAITNTVLQIVYRLFHRPHLVPFFISISLIGEYIFPLSDLLGGGGDAISIWQTIVTFRNETITSSYVLYKGFLAVYPYVWLYQWATSLELDPFLFIKIYHSLLFAYVSAIGMPHVISHILSVKLKSYRNIIYVCTIYIMFKFTNIFSMLMIDLPSWAFFVGAVSSVILISNRVSERIKYDFLYFFLSGCLVGLNFCGSGQYSVAGYLIFIFLCMAAFKQYRLKQLSNNITILLLVLFFSFGVSAPKAYDSYFEKTVVQPMRDRDEWLPTKKEWLVNGMTRLLPHYKYGEIEFSRPIDSNRGLAIIKKTEGPTFSERYARIKQGGGVYSSEEYLRILQGNAFDFLVMWGTKAFLSISFDGGNAKVSHLLVSYTSLFLCFYLLYVRCNKIHDLFNLNSLIILAVISTIAGPVFLFIDMRYIVALQSLIIGFALLDDFIWNRFNHILLRLKDVLWNRESIHGNMYAIPYPLILFAAYILFCFLLYGALLEISGSNPSKVLFRF